MSKHTDTLALDRKLSVVVDSMRFPLIFLVIIVHMLPMEHSRLNLSWDLEEIYILVSEMLSHNLGRLAVPCYFLISGYYFFQRYSKNNSRFFADQIKKRWHTLLLPYLIWNLILIIAIFSKYHLFMSLGRGSNEDYETLQNSTVYQLFWGMPINFPLWYIRDLICMVLLSPLFFVFFKYTKYFGILFLGLLFGAVMENQIPGLSMTAFFFFGLGAYLALNRINLLIFSAKYRLFCAIVTLIFLVAATMMNGTEYHEYIVRLFIFFGVISTVNIFAFLSSKKTFISKLTDLSPVCFFVYVTHEIYIINWLKGAASRLSIIDFGWGKLFMYFLVPVLCVLVCVGLYKLLKNIIPTLLAISLGRRLQSKTSNKERRLS